MVNHSSQSIVVEGVNRVSEFLVRVLVQFRGMFYAPELENLYFS